MKKLLTLAFLIFVFCQSYSQIKLYPTQPPIFKNHKTNDLYRYPFSGGITAPQFATIDANFDGRKDLVVYDRVGASLSVYADTAKSGSPLWVHDAFLSAKFPKISNWFRMVDYDRDGDLDIFTNQYSDFIVYNNKSTGGDLIFERRPDSIYSFLDSNIFGFNTINLPCFTFMYPEVNDIDNDGDYDILVTDLQGGLLNLYQNVQVERKLPKDSLMFMAVDFCYGGFFLPTGDNKVGLGYSCDRYYERHAHAGTTITAYDFDNDGDKDLLLGDAFLPELLYIKNGKKEYNWAYDSAIAQDTIYLPNEGGGAKSFTFPASFLVDVDADDILDLLVASNDEKVNQGINNIQFFKNTGSNKLPNFKYQTNSFLHDQTIDEGYMNNPVFFDVDGDSLMDLIVGTGGDNFNNQDTTSVLKLYKNIGTKIKPEYILTDSNWLGMRSQKIIWPHPAFGDVDGDNLPDLLVGHAKGKIMWWKNTGTALSPVFSLQKDSFAGINLGTPIAPALGDIDGDGDNDMLIGRYNGELNYYRNNSGTFTLVTDTFGNINVSDSFFDYTCYCWMMMHNGMAVPVLYDFDNNGKLDLMAGSYKGSLRLYMDAHKYINAKAEETDSFQFNFVSDTFENIKYNTFISPAVAMLDGDSLPDILVGTQRGGFYFWGSQKITQFKSIINPVQLAEQLAFEIFPNPAHDKINIVLPSDIGNVYITLSDIAGKIILRSKAKTGNYISVDLQSQPLGVYILKIENDKGAAGYKKIVKD
ncbi:MAG: T9SS type A sorting domain-containing protein [Bacteroidota bacterium]|nr:T9SS type A sorting domain-containing protein [Bacteroidota bacterium]